MQPSDAFDLIRDWLDATGTDYLDGETHLWVLLHGSMAGIFEAPDESGDLAELWFDCPVASAPRETDALHRWVSTNSSHVYGFQGYVDVDGSMSIGLGYFVRAWEPAHIESFMTSLYSLTEVATAIRQELQATFSDVVPGPTNFDEFRVWRGSSDL